MTHEIAAVAAILLSAALLGFSFLRFGHGKPFDAIYLVLLSWYLYTLVLGTF